MDDLVVELAKLSRKLPIATTRDSLHYWKDAKRLEEQQTKQGEIPAEKN